MILHFQLICTLTVYFLHFQLICALPVYFLHFQLICTLPVYFLHFQLICTLPVYFLHFQLIYTLPVYHLHFQLICTLPEYILFPVNMYTHCLCFTFPFFLQFMSLSPVLLLNLYTPRLPSTVHFKLNLVFKFSPLLQSQIIFSLPSTLADNLYIYIFLCTSLYSKFPLILSVNLYTPNLPSCFI